ncbi:MAG: hypothetical protein WD768_05670 [Phycisphaeraceae bacterium]
MDYPTPEVKLSLYAAGSPPTYPGLNRFGRVIDHRWTDYGSSTDVARIQHGYDRNSNRLWRQNDVARSLSKKFDQQYSYDRLNRLTDFKQGLLDGSHQIPDSGADLGGVSPGTGARTCYAIRPYEPHRTDFFTASQGREKGPHAVSYGRRS